MALLGKALMIVENLPVPFDRRVWLEAMSLNDAGYQVFVICPTGKGCEKKYEEIDDIHIYRHPLPPEASNAKGYLREYLYALTWEFRLARKIWKDRGGFDIVHVCNPPDLLFLVGSWFKLFKGTRVILDQHSLNPELYEVKFGRRDLFYHALLLAERLTFACADVVISTNESYRNIALTRGKKKAKQVFVVRSGPDLAKFTLLPPNKDYFHNKAYLVGYVGVMGEQEGIDYLLRAVRMIVYELGRKDIHFMLVGGGPAVEAMKELAEKLKVSDYVEFTGRVSDRELIERLSSCDLCVSPDPKTPFNDVSTMNKIVEYMALGKAIVQFDVLEGRRSAGAASFYAKANDEADFAQKIIQLLESPERRLQMGIFGMKRMRDQLEWRHQIPKLLEAYAHALPENRQV